MSDAKHELPSPVELPAPISGASATQTETHPMLPEDEGTHEKKNLQSSDPLGLGPSQMMQGQGVAQDTTQVTDDHATQAKQLASASPQIADDTDLIEKEWVEKAKEIVAKTKENPYLQNKAINEMKTDYIKKRYNKDITTNSASS